MKNLKLFILVTLMLAMVVSACGGAETPVPQATPGTSAATSGAQPAATTMAEAEATSGTQPAATTVAEAEVTAESTEGVSPTAAGEEDLNLDNVSSGLTQLASYKSSLTMSFTGKDALGQAVEKTWTMQEEFIKDPPAQRVIWSGSESTGGQPPTVTSWETVTVNQTTYMISRDASGTETCFQMTSSDATPPVQALTPDMWGSINDAHYVGTETVNGVRAKHYTWKEGALTSWGFTQGKADTWVAVDGGYVVKQTVEATGKGVLLAGTDEEGTTTWEWNVTEANGSFQIQPPAGCESAAAGIPIMADATDKTVVGDMVTYSSPSALADVVSFYKAEMPKAGWQASGTPTEMEGFATLEFTKAGSTASIMISWDLSTQKTTVVANVIKQ